MRFLKGLRTWPVFGKGWSRRVAEVKAASLAMADRAAGRIPGEVPASRTTGKGSVPINKTARNGTAGGAVATGGATAQQAAEGGADWIVIAIIVAVTLAVAAGAWTFWRWRQKRRQEAAA
jgi:lysozyme family protein